MKPIFRDIFIFSVLVVLVFVVMRTPEPVYNVSPVSKIEKRIQGKETQIVKYETKVLDQSKLIAGFSHQIDLLRSELDFAKNRKDTVTIVQIQDTMIRSLTAQGMHKDTVILAQRDVITAQRYIINSKDTLLAISAHDLKRVKRQRNISLIVNALQTAFLIIK